MSDRSVVVRLGGEIGQYKAAMAEASRVTQKVSKDATAAAKECDLAGPVLGVEDVDTPRPIRTASTFTRSGPGQRTTCRGLSIRTEAVEQWSRLGFRDVDGSGWRH